MTINLFIRKNLKIIIIIIFTILYIYTFFDEVTEFNKGFGWDGPRNQEISKHGVETIINRTTTMHNVQGFLPMVIYEFLIKTLNFPIHSHGIVLFFRFFNIAITIGIFALISKISRIRNYTIQTTILFYGMVLFSFFTLKFFNYNPIIRDHFSILVALFGIFSVLKKKFTLITIAIFLSFFNQPLVMYPLFIILFFNVKDKILFHINDRMIKRLLIFFGILLAIYFVFIYLRLVNIAQPLELKIYGYPILNKIYLIYSLFFIFIYFLYLIYCIIKSSKGGFDFGIDKTMIIPILTICIIEFFANKYFASKQVFSADGFWYNQLIMPGVFLLNHLYYINISVLFLFYFLPDILTNAYRIGKGWYLSFIFILLLMIIGETRIIIGSYIFLIFGLIDFLNIKRDTYIFKYLYLLIFILIICSRFWMKLNGNLDFYFLNFAYTDSLPHFYIKLIYFIFLLLMTIWFSKKTKTLL
jgi:hypothetical protein